MKRMCSVWLNLSQRKWPDLFEGIIQSVWDNWGKLWKFCRRTYSLRFARHSRKTALRCHYRNIAGSTHEPCPSCRHNFNLSYPSALREVRWRQGVPSTQQYMRLYGPRSGVGRSERCPLSLEIKPCISGSQAHSPTTILTKIYEL
jgi:hypothetical protein